LTIAYDDHSGSGSPKNFKNIASGGKRLDKGKRIFILRFIGICRIIVTTFQAVTLLNTNGRVFVMWHGEGGLLKVDTQTGRWQARWGRAHLLFFALI